MTDDERSLLLTVARLMRAKINNEIYAEQEDDLWAISEALKPFDPDPSQDHANEANDLYAIGQQMPGVTE